MIINSGLIKQVALYLLLIMPIFVFADISPNPIQVKGIIPAHPVNIQMVSERVNVELSMDSSWVECTFYMHNLGEAQDLEIGFPMMNFYLFQDKYPNQEKFKVWVNGHEIKRIDMHIPENLQALFNSNANTYEHYDLIKQYENQNKPWYLWKAHFDRNESQTIIVKYILPNGATKQNRFFNYLLSTGAGWAGKIERAEVVVNMNNIPDEQLLSIAPKHYSTKKFIAKGQQLTWIFKNLKPKITDDILIEYEMKKGEYATEMKKIDSMAHFIDGKKKSGNRFIAMNSTVAGLEINYNPPYQKWGVIKIFTNEYTLKKFKKKIKPLNREIWKQISKESVASLPNNYRLILNNEAISEKYLFVNMFSIDTIPILKINIKPTDSLKKDLILITAKPLQN